MEFLKLFIWFWTGWFVGALSAAYLLVQALIVLRVGIPLTLAGLRNGSIKTKALLFQYILSAVLLIALFVVAFLCVRYFASGSFVIGYYVGVLLALYKGIPESGPNLANCTEFVTKNVRYIIKGELSDAAGAGEDQSQSSGKK